MKNAVLFIIFNRPDTARLVFEEIRKAKPPKLYIAADGPRKGLHDEGRLCDQARSLASKIDWVCELHTRFQDKNIGCKKAVSGAVDWFFENEEQGIILEDDTVPSEGFFDFCDDMLERYRNDEKIAMISGFNPLGANIDSSEYFFSRNPSIWGWATWRSRWNRYDVHMSDWNSKIFFKKMKNELPIYVLEYYLEAYEKVANGELNTWDYQWGFLIQTRGDFVVKPCANMISNIGIFGTHSSKLDKNHMVAFGLFSPENISISSVGAHKRYDDYAWYDYEFNGRKSYLYLRFFLRIVGLLNLIRNIKKIFRS